MCRDEPALPPSLTPLLNHKKRVVGTILCSKHNKKRQQHPKLEKNVFLDQPVNSLGDGCSAHACCDVISTAFGAKTPVKKTKPAEPRPAGARGHVTKHVMVDQRVDKYGNYGLTHCSSVTCNSIPPQSCKRLIDRVWMS